MSGTLSALRLIRAGVERRRAIVTGVAVAVLTSVALVAVLFTSLGGCLSENRTPQPPASWPWSPRRQFCDEGSRYGLGIWAVVVVPVLSMTAGALLAHHRRPGLARIARGLTDSTLFIPGLYLRSLDYYRLDRYPVLDQALLRPAAGSRPARVCWVYGIQFGPSKVVAGRGTVRECVDLAHTPEADRLTGGYDQGRSSYDLDLAGHNLTQKGRPIVPRTTGVEGLPVTRADRLPEAQARLGASELN